MAARRASTATSVAASLTFPQRRRRWLQAAPTRSWSFRDGIRAGFAAEVDDGVGDGAQRHPVGPGVDAEHLERLVEADARRSLARDERTPPAECSTRSPRLWTARSGRDAAARLRGGTVMQGEDVAGAEVDGEPVGVVGVGDGCELVHDPQAEAAECAARSGLGNEA